MVHVDIIHLGLVMCSLGDALSESEFDRLIEGFGEVRPDGLVPYEPFVKNIFEAAK